MVLELQKKSSRLRVCLIVLLAFNYIDFSRNQLYYGITKKPRNGNIRTGLHCLHYLFVKDDAFTLDLYL